MLFSLAITICFQTKDFYYTHTQISYDLTNHHKKYNCLQLKMLTSYDFGVTVLFLDLNMLICILISFFLHCNFLENALVGFLQLFVVS